MPRLLQIDTCLALKSTGRITESIAKLAISRGWECHIIHGARTLGETVQNHYQATTLLGTYFHFIESYLFDRHGLGSKRTTKTIIETIEKIEPDLIQLHCIHGYYINYKVLFEYLNKKNIPLVWTFHDCWAFTGHCAHFVTVGCEKWKTECYKCPLRKDYPKSLIDCSRRNFQLKKRLFTSNNNLHIVAVSQWLADLAKQSFFKECDIRVINNGVDTTVFHPCSGKSSESFKILGVASDWNAGKGLFDFYKIREKLSEKEYEITLVGLTQKQIEELPKGITGIAKTNSVTELAKLYSEANVFVNPTYADSFPTVNMEALSCGTPIITYKTGGSPEIIDDITGVVVEQGDTEGLVRAIANMKEKQLSSEKCRERALARFDKEQRFMDYIKMYEELI